MSNEVEFVIGIDPGVSGGFAILSRNGTVIQTHAFKHTTFGDTAAILSEYRVNNNASALIEAVHSTPQMGVKSAFTFGFSTGTLHGLLYGVGISFDTVSPQRWQKEMHCLSKGNKNVTKSKAQALFPQIKITHAIADALLIAEYRRREIFRVG